MKKYLCGITWRHELGETNIDGHIHDSVEELKAHHSCWEECGIVEIEIDDENFPEKYTAHVWIVPEDLDWRKFQKANGLEELAKKFDISKIDRAEVPGTGKIADEIRREDN